MTIIYIKEVGDSERFLGSVIHNHIKEYKQVYDKFECVQRKVGRK